jgi:hypothetical protein
MLILPLLSGKHMGSERAARQSGHNAAEVAKDQVVLGLALLRLFLLRPVRCPNPLCFAASDRLAE